MTVNVAAQLWQNGGTTSLWLIHLSKCGLDLLQDLGQNWHPCVSGKDLKIGIQGPCF